LLFFGFSVNLSKIRVKNWVATLRRKEGKNYAMLNGHRWFLQKKKNKKAYKSWVNNSSIAKRYVFSLLISQVTMMRV